MPEEFKKGAKAEISEIKDGIYTGYLALQAILTSRSTSS
jgi:hypothetical protein